MVAGGTFKFRYYNLLSSSVLDGIIALDDEFPTSLKAMTVKLYVTPGYSSVTFTTATIVFNITTSPPANTGWLYETK